MGMSINGLSGARDRELYFDPDFRRTLESYMGWLREHPETVTIPVSSHEGYKWEGDLYGLLENQGIPEEYRWLVMRVNNLYRPGEVDERISVLLIPDFGVVDRVMQMYRTATKKNIT